MDAKEVLVSAGAVVLVVGFLGLFAWVRRRNRELGEAEVRVVRGHPGVVERLGRARLTFVNEMSWQTIGRTKYRYITVWVAGRRGPVTVQVDFVPVYESGQWRAHRVWLAPWWPWSERANWSLERDHPLAAPVSLR